MAREWARPLLPLFPLAITFPPPWKPGPLQSGSRFTSPQGLLVEGEGLSFKCVILKGERAGGDKAEKRFPHWDVTRVPEELEGQAQRAANRTRGLSMETRDDQPLFTCHPQTRPCGPIGPSSPIGSASTFMQQLLRKCSRCQDTADADFY